MKQFNLVGLLTLTVFCSIATVNADWNEYTIKNVPTVPHSLADEPAENILGVRFLSIPLLSDNSKIQSATLSMKKWPEIPESIADNAQVTVNASFLYYLNNLNEDESVEFLCSFFNGKNHKKVQSKNTQVWTRFDPTNFHLTREEYKNLLNENSLFEIKTSVHSKDSKTSSNTNEEPLQVAIADAFVSVIFENDKTEKILLDFKTVKDVWQLQIETDDKDKPINVDLENVNTWSNPSMPSLPVQLPPLSFSTQKYVRNEKEEEVKTKTPTESTNSSEEQSTKNEDETKNAEPVTTKAPELVETETKSTIESFFYTDLSEKSHNISSIIFEPIQQDQDFCFYFAYYSTVKTQLKVRLFAPDPNFEWPADQTYKGKKPEKDWQYAPTVTSETVVALLTSTNRNQKKLSESPFEWQNVEVCIKRDAYPSRSSDLLPGGNYTLELTSVLFNEADKESLIAVSFLDTVFVQNNNQHLHSFFADWATDGMSSSLQWNSPAQNKLLELKVIEANNQNSFEFVLSQPNNQFESDHRVFSSWISLIDSKFTDDSEEEIDDSWMTEYFATSQENSTVTNQKRALRFVNQIIEEDIDIDSNLDFSFTLTNDICKASLVISVQNDKLVETILKKIELACQTTQTEQVTFTINEELKQHLKSDRMRLVFSVHLASDLNPDNTKQMKISSFQLANACNSKSNDVCNSNLNIHSESGRNKCELKSRKHYRCKCNSISHGAHCQYVNYCLIAKPNESKTGSEICSNGEAEGCRPFGNDYFCKCASGQQWDDSENKCSDVNPCLYANCGLGEECKLNPDSDEGYECVCANGYVLDSKTGKCLPDTCKNACSKDQLCATIPGQTKPLCYCKPGFKSNPSKLSECIPLAEANPLVRQWNKCHHYYNEVGQCLCSAGYSLSKKDNKTCIPNKELETNCNCSDNQICVVKTENNKKSYTCECPIGLKGDQCDQDNYCENKANKKDIEKLCGNQESGCVFENNTFACTSCDAQHEVDPLTGRCVLRQDLCNQLNCDPKSETCQLQFDKENKLVAACQCALGYKNKTEPNGSKCVHVCDEHTCESSQGECIFDPIKGSPICSCRAGYSYENNVCTLSKNAVHIQGRLRLKPLPSLQEKQRKLMHAIRVQPQLDCKHAHDVPSCLKLARELNSKLIGAHQPYKSTYLPLQFESTLEEVLASSDQAWTTASGKTFNSKSQARILSLRPMSEDVDTELDLDFGFNREYLADIAMVIVGGELSEREKQWRNICIRKPLPAVLVTTTAPSKTTTVATTEETTQVSSAKNVDQECIIENRLTWRPKQTNVGWLNLCRLGLHNCERYSVCQGGRGQYKCGCEQGFRSVHQLNTVGFVQDKCLDIDECSESLHRCEPSTVCENQLGSYRCKCLENFRRVDQFQCEEACSSKFVCHHGRCEVFAKHYEICRCYDGYKGEDCNTEDPKVVSLKQTLISVIVGLCLLLLIALSIAFLFIQSSRSKARSLKRALRNEATEMQTRTRDSDKGQSNFAYQSEQNLTRV